MGFETDGILSSLPRMIGSETAAPPPRRDRLRNQRQSTFLAPAVARTREWCGYEGTWGLVAIVALCATVINLIAILALHCFPLFDTLQGRPGVRKMLLISAGQSWLVGIICVVLLFRVSWALVLTTCRHGRLHAYVRRRLTTQSYSGSRVCRAWQLAQRYTSPGGRFFDMFEFARELLETVLQIAAVREYADNGVDRNFLDAYVFFILLNSLSAIALMVPKLLGRRSSWLLSPTVRGRRERLLLTTDLICDTAYSLFPTVYLVIVVVSTLYGQRGRRLCQSLYLKNQACKDAQGIILMPMLVELLLGGSAEWKRGLKLVTRLAPIWFAASRVIEAFEATAVGRETETAAAKESPMQGEGAAIELHDMAKADRDVSAGSMEFNPLHGSSMGRPATSSPRRMKASSPREKSTLTRSLEAEQSERASRPPLPVPLWMSGALVALTWSFCIFAWVRFAQLSSPCQVAGTPWPTNCRSPSHPLFDFALPGPDNMCACNSFAAAPAGNNDGLQGGGGGIVSSAAYDCSNPRFMADLATSLLQANAKSAAVSPYVATMMFEPGCAVNNTHVHGMLDRLSNLRIIAVQNSKAIVPPLRLPTAAMNSKSKLMTLFFKGLHIDEIPSEIGQLSTTLTMVSIQGNPLLRKLPAELNRCTSLGLLFLKHNNLSALPTGLGRLTGLNSLALANNFLSSLPTELESLTNMMSLYLSQNLITSVPASFARMTILRYLSIAANRLTEFPVLQSSPQAWPKLAHLSVEANNISAWPKQWTVKSDTQIAKLPFIASETAVGHYRDELYDKYAELSSSADQANNPTTLLVLVNGNPVTMAANQTTSSTAATGDGGASRILETSRNGDEVLLPGMLVSNRPECSPGCPSTQWKASKYAGQDFREDLQCQAECNTTTCDWDGGDCTSGRG